MELYLDHVLIAVRDLGRARRVYGDLLGFTVTPEGVHPGRGTHNRLIVFGPEYLELIGIRDAQEAREDRPQMLDFLSRGQGLYMFALGSRDLEAAVAQVRRHGGRISDPVDGARAGAQDGGGYTWRSAHLDPVDTPGSATFMIQHNQTIQQRYTEPANPTRHRNGATGIFSLSLAVEDAQAAGSAWGRLLGLAVGAAAEDEVDRACAVRLKLENCGLELLSPLDQTGPVARHLEGRGPSPYRLTLRVSDLAGAAARLAARGVVVGEPRQTRDGRSRGLEGSQTEGANLELVQAR